MEGILAFGITFVLVAIVAFIIRLTRNSYSVEIRQTVIECKLLALEEALLGKVAAKKDIDLDKQLMLSELSPRGKFRDRLYKEVMKEMFDQKVDK